MSDRSTWRRRDDRACVARVRMEKYIQHAVVQRQPFDNASDAEDEFVLRHPVHPLVAVEHSDRPVLLLIEDVEAFPPGQDGRDFIF